MSDLYPTLSLGEKTPVPNDLDENIVVAPLQPLSVWSNQAGANIQDPITKSLGYANYQRGHYFRTGQLNDDLESNITQGLVSSLLEQELIDAEQANSEELLRTIQPEPDIQTKTNLIRMAYGEQAGSTWLENQSSGSGNQKELDNQLNSAKTLLVDSGLLSFARVSDEKGNNKVIGGVNITDRGKALDDSVRLGALNYSDAYRVMSGLKKEQDAKTNFEIIREAQILSELNNVLGSDDRSGEVSQNALDVMRGLVKAKDLDPSANQQSDVLAVVGDIRKGLSAAYASKNGFGEGAALQRYSDKEIKEAVELLAANEVNERGEFNFYEDDNTKNIRILGSGHVLAHPNLMQQKDVFERAIESDDRLSPSQLKSLRNQRKLFRELTYDQYNQFLSDSAATSNNWMAAKQAGKVKNLSDTDILDEFLADRRNYSSIKNRLGDVVATVPDAVIGLFASLGAVIFKSEGATKYLVDNQRARQRRRDIASVFGDDFGWGMDLSNVVAPMVVDVSATALLSAGTLGLGGVAYASTKAGVTSTAKALAKNLTKAVTGRQFGDTAKDLALKKQVQKKVNDSVDVVASEGVQEAIKQYNKAVANGVFRKAAPFPSLFLTAANRSAGNTYATIYDAQPDNLTHEEKHDAALGYALLSGTTTGLITSAFMGVGLGGFEQAFLRGMTYKGMSAGMSKILNLDVRGLTSTKVKEAIRVSIEKQLKQAAKKSRFIRQFGIPAASEAAEEGIDEFIQTFIMDAALNEDTPMIDRVMTGLHAASIGGVMGGGVVGVQSMMDKGRGARYEKFQEDTIDNIISDLEGSSPLTQQFLRDNREEITRQLRTASRAREPITTSVSDVDVDMITDRYNEYLSGQISQKEFEERTNSTLKEAEGFVDGVEVSQAKELLIQDIDKELAQKKITEQDSDVIVKESQQRETQAGGLSQETEEELEIKRQQEIKREEEFIGEFDAVWGTKELSEELGEGQTAEQHYDRYIEARRDAETVASFFGMEVRVDRNKKNKFLGAYRAVGTKQGMVLVINPFGLARLTMGLNKSNAQHVARFEAFHEVIHHASWRNLSKAEIDVIFETFNVDQINEIVNLYYNTDQKKAASRQRLGPTSLSSQRISEQHVIVDEFLRMKAQRILKGYTTEEEIEFYKSNPNFVRVLLRYLRSYVNRFKAARELDKDNPVVSAAVNRLTGEMARLKGGFDIDPVVRFDVDDPEKSLDKLIEFLDDAPSISRDPSRRIDMGVRQTQEGSFEYRGAHTAPDRGYGSPMSAMDESIYPSDFYSSDGLRLYGTGSSYDTISDQKVYNQIVSVRGKPEAKVIVYRGVPNNIQGAVINAGDWVTTDIRYAELHGARMHGDEGFKILRKEVKAGELFTEGNSIYEFGYSPSTDIRETQAGALNNVDGVLDSVITTLDNSKKISDTNTGFATFISPSEARKASRIIKQELSSNNIKTDEEKFKAFNEAIDFYISSQDDPIPLGKDGWDLILEEAGVNPEILDIPEDFISDYLSEVRETQAGGIESGSFDTDEGGIEYGSYPPLFELPFLATGKYQRKKEGIFGRFLNKFTGDVDIRVKRLLEQRKQIQEAVGDDFLKFKAQLDLIIKEDFGGKAPVELIQILTGSRENITPETDQEYADDLVNAGASTEDQIKKVRAAYVARKKKEFRDKKKQAITELGKLQNVPEKDSNNTRLVKHLLGDGLDLSDSNKKVLGLRDLTDQISGVIRDIVGADSEIGIAIDDNMEMYLHKTYRLFTDKEYRDSIRKDEKYENVRATAGAFLLKQYKTLNKEWESDMVDRGLDPDKKTDVQAFKEALVNDYLDIHLSEKRETSNLFQSLRTHTKGVVSLNADVLKKRKNPPKELRDLLGESEDTTGFDTLLETFQHIGLIAAHANFLRNLKKFGTSSTLLSGDPFLIEKKEGQEAPEGFSLLYENNESNKNPEGNPVVNAPFKDGKSYYVLTELKEALEAILSPEAKVKETEAKKAQEFMTKVGSRLTGLSLGAKTLGSVGFYVRNILSNVLFFGPSQGFWGMNKMLGSFGKEFMRKKYLSMTPQEVSAFHRTLISLGVIGNEIESRLIQDFLTNPRSEEQFQNELLSELDKIKAQEKVENKDFLDDSLEKLSDSKVAKSSKFIGRRLRELSQTVDSFYKIAYFMNELEVLQQARAKHNTQGGINYAEMSDQKLMDLAAQKVKRTAQSYDQAPPFVQNLQDTWFGVMFAPFIRFKLEVPRIMINTVRLAKEEMSDSNPVIRKRGKKRLQSFTGVLVGFSALAPVIVNTLSGIGDDEDEALRDSMPEYLRTHSFFYVPLTGNKDELYSLDLTYLNPYAMMVDPFLRAFEQIWRGSPSQAGGAFAKAMIADQYLDQQILAGAVTSAISNRDPETGKPIREVNDTSFESLYKTFSFVFAESLMPRTPEKIYKEGFVKLMEGDPDMTDFILTPLGAVAKEFLPLKPFRIQPERSLDRFLSERAAEYRRSSSIKGRMYTDNSLSEGFIQKLADTDVERRRRINEHLIKTFRGYRKLGLTNQQIYSQAMEKGYGKRRMALLLNGLMERPSLTKPFINNMVRKGDTHIERLRTYQSQLNTYGRYIPVE